MAALRLAALAAHLQPSLTSSQSAANPHIHDLNPAYFLPRAAAIEPSAPAILHCDRSNTTISRTYSELAERARRVSVFLLRNYAPGTKIGILSSNTPMFLECLYGIAGSGLTQASFNYRLSAKEIRDVLEISGVTAVFVDIEFLPIVQQAAGELATPIELIVDLDSEDPKDLREFRAAGHLNLVFSEIISSLSTDTTPWDSLHYEDQPEDSLLALAFTSGTTGKPKAVEYTHRGMYLAAMANIIEAELNRSSSGCRYLWTLPMFHAGGWSFPYAVTAVRGLHICLRRIDYDLVWRYLNAGPGKSATHYNAAPTVNLQICEHPSAKRVPEPVMVTVAASPPSPALFKKMVSLNLLPVHTYGMTETYGPISRGYILSEWASESEEQQFKKMARQGHGFLTSRKLRVVKQKSEYSNNPDSLEDVARNGSEIGEVVFQGNICMKGYHNDEEATKKVWDGGWLHSGDLAVVHPDGAIEILDRGKDIIISGGENISSVAVENVLSAHPAILEVAVIGIPDEKFGEKPKAIIILRPEAKSTDPATLTRDLIAFARKHLGGFQVPKDYSFVEDLPKTSTGKIRKKELREA
ncbi:putative AMP-binding domain protein [Myxozyma melibiosi]|uniref:AMP-binding domain protein n=1 Tax=Myxozyma melibiosi TaxID=54550 RepID=A0ABR1F728_9ASCO